MQVIIDRLFLPTFWFNMLNCSMLKRSFLSKNKYLTWLCKCAALYVLHMSNLVVVVLSLLLVPRRVVKRSSFIFVGVVHI